MLKIDNSFPEVGFYESIVFVNTEEGKLQIAIIRTTKADPRSNTLTSVITKENAQQIIDYLSEYVSDDSHV